MKNLITVAGLCKKYQDFALDDVSFHVQAGTVTGFVGRNGAGKTTTMRVLLGLSPFSAGSISYFGEQNSGRDPSVRSRIGVVLDGGFYDELTAAEMKRIIARAYPSWSETDYRRCMDLFSLDPRRKLKTFSRGMRAQFALTLALSHQAELLIMDEPTSGLDPLIRRDLLDVLRDYMEGGERAVLFSTHITSDLDRVADDIILMDEGRIVFQENRDDLLSQYRLVKGPSSKLTPQVRALVKDIRESPFAFTGITAAASELRRVVPDVLFEPATIEDIMAAHVGREEEEGREHAWASV